MSNHPPYLLSNTPAASAGVDQRPRPLADGSLALFYLIIGIATLRFYGLTWDEGLWQCVLW
jgi:hypothetical protein